MRKSKVTSKVSEAMVEISTFVIFSAPHPRHIHIYLPFSFPSPGVVIGQQVETIFTTITAKLHHKHPDLPDSSQFNSDSTLVHQPAPSTTRKESPFVERGCSSDHELTHP